MNSPEYLAGPPGPELEIAGFFVGWPNPPGENVLRQLLANSSEALLAVENGRLIGYVTALTDHVLFSSITSLEVLPEYQGRGIGQELMTRMLARLKGVYATDLVCDESVAPFYERLGLRRLTGMAVRRYDLQAGTL